MIRHAIRNAARQAASRLLDADLRDLAEQALRDHRLVRAGEWAELRGDVDRVRRDRTRLPDATAARIAEARGALAPIDEKVEATALAIATLVNDLASARDDAGQAHLAASDAQARADAALSRAEQAQATIKQGTGDV